MSLDELDRVARERLIGSPPHSFQLLGTMERLRYLERVGTMGALGTVLLTVRIGTLGKVNRIGTLDEMTRVGTLNRLVGGRVGTLGRLGSVHYIERIGTVQRLGTIRYLGTVGRIGTAHTGTVPILTKGRDFDPVSIASGSRIGQGAAWLGAWVHIGSFLTKTYSVLLWGRGSPGIRVGSFAVIAGPVGTTTNRTGTYYGPIPLGKGTLNTISFTETMRWTRPYVRRSGTYGGGTVSVFLGRQT